MRKFRALPYLIANMKFLPKPSRFISFGFLLAILGLPAEVLAQKPKPADFGIESKKALEFYLQGQQLAEWRDRDGAILAYQEAINLEPDFAHAHYELGIQDYVKRNYNDAFRHLTIASKMQAEFPAIGFYLGESAFYTSRYEEAFQYLGQFVKSGQGRPQDLKVATANLRHAEFARVAIKDSFPINRINMGEAINSPNHDFLPYLTADGQTLLFVSRRQESTGGYNPQLNDYDEDFFYSEKTDGKWQPAKNLGPPINTELNEGAAAMTQDGKTIYFTACNRDDGFGNCDIYVSRWTGKGWSEPENLGRTVNTEYKETQPALSHDGKFLYFSSNRPGGQGMGDIWVCRKDGAGWGPAENLGPAVNTPGNEEGPFIHADGVSLYFASNIHPGFGGSDLFVSYQQTDGTWGAPVNLGYPLNTSASETNLFVSTQGDQAFITAIREDGVGRADIYELTLPEKVRPKISTFLRGLVRDSVTRAPVYARLRILDLATGDTIRNELTGRSDGRFLMSLPGGKDYAALVNAPNYLFASRNFSLKNLAGDTYFDLIIDLSPIRKNVEVVLQNIFFDTGKWDLKSESEVELDFLRDFLTNNPGLRIEIQGHTDDVGKDSDNLLLSQNRANAVRDWLIGKGISASRLTSVGYGESQPLVPNDSDESRAKNRRTQFKVIDTK